jgi:hypothetical protein
MVKPKSKQSFDPVIDKKRAVHITVYDLQGGPIPPDVIQFLEDAAFNATQMNSHLAISTSVV